MAKNKRGKVKVNLDKERTLYFDLNALCLLEENGINITDLQNGVKMSQVRAILWAGLVHEDPELTLEAVGALVTADCLEEVSTAIGEAFSAGGKK